MVKDERNGFFMINPDEIRCRLRLLDLSEHCSLEDVRKQFILMIKKYHPDSCNRFTKDEATKKAQEIIASYEWLMNNWQSVQTCLNSNQEKDRNDLAMLQSVDLSKIRLKNEWFKPLWSITGLLDGIEFIKRWLLWLIQNFLMYAFLSLSHSEIDLVNIFLIGSMSLSVLIELFRMNEIDHIFAPNWVRKLYETVMSKNRVVGVASAILILIRLIYGRI